MGGISEGKNNVLYKDSSRPLGFIQRKTWRMTNWQQRHITSGRELVEFQERANGFGWLMLHEWNEFQGSAIGSSSIVFVDTFTSIR